MKSYLSGQKAEDAIERIKLSESLKITHFDDGEILFEYPNNWNIKSIKDDKRIITGIYGNNVMFHINRGKIDGISLTEFVELLVEAFTLQNIRVISKTVLNVDEIGGVSIKL